MRRSRITIMAMLLLLASVPASAAITHRFDFAVDANDVIGGLESTLVSDALVSGGSLILDGTDDILEMDAAGIAANTYGAITMEMWYTPTSGTNTGNTMLAYLGANNASATWMGINYLFITSARADDLSRGAISCNNTGDPWVTESGVNGPEYDDGVKHHMAVSVDGTQISLCIDGQLIGTSALSTDNRLNNISNELAILGRGGYLQDPEWNGSIQEFRIYDKALTPGEAALSKFSGEDNPPVLAIRSTTPVYGQTLVSVMPILSWTLEPGITVDSYTLYYGTDPNIMDPNKPDVSGISTVVPLSNPSYAFTSPLANNENYYWRVDTVVGATTYQGAGNMFTTIPPYPAFTVNPSPAYVFENGTAVFTATCESESPMPDDPKWFKVGTPDVEITDADPDVSIVRTDNGFLVTTTLTISNVEAADTGSYYARAVNEGGPAQSTAAALIIKKQVAYWPLDGNANDMEGAYNGTPTGTTSFVAGKVGQALELPGGTTVGYINLPAGFADFTGGLTFNVWAYPRTAANWARLIAFGNGAPNDTIFFTRNGTSAHLEYTVTKPTAGQTLRASNAITLNQWQMFTVTQEPNGTVRIYKNGLQVATGTVQVPTNISRTMNYIGKSHWNDNYFNGWLDEIRVFNYALTADEVADQYVLDSGAPYCRYKPAYDYDNNCVTNLADFATFAAQWLTCGRYPSSECPQL